MTPAQHLAMAYPALVAGVAPDVIAWALLMAQDYRPGCLSPPRQDIAQAHYAAYLLARRAAEATSGGNGPSGAIIEEREGDLTTKYAHGAGVEGPSSAYASWQALNNLCSRGAIITRFGVPR